MKNELVLSANEFKIDDVTGVIPSISKTLASLALLDNIITLDEFVIIADASKKLAQISDNPLLVNTLTLHWILNPVSLKVALKELSIASKDVDSNTKEIIFGVLNEVILLQGNNSEKLQNDVAHALGIDIKKFSDQAIDMIGNLSKTISSKLVFKKSRIERLKEFCRIYNNSTLSEVIETITSDDQIDSSVERIIEESKITLYSALSDFESANKAHPDYENAVIQLNELSEIMVEQIRNRLDQIGKRINAEKTIFEEDFNSFLEDTALEYELVMKDRVFSSEYTRKDVWKEFSKSEAALIIQHRYDRFKKKYQQLLELWNGEVNAFAQELSATQPALMKTFNRQEFAEILPTTSGKFNALLQVDRLTGGIMDLTFAGALSTSLAVGLGVIQGTTIIAALSTPVGMGIAGAVGLAGLYKIIARPDIRINLEIGKMSKELAIKLSETLDNPVEKHSQALSEIESRFNEVAAVYYKPLLINSRLATLYKDYNQKVMMKIISDTNSYIQKL